jgi:hypothetical protein
MPDIDTDLLRLKGQTCAEWAEVSPDEDMRDRWRISAEFWFRTADIIDQNDQLLNQWERTRISKP